MARTRFAVETGMFFRRAGLEQARADFAALRSLAEQTPPPCRAFVHLTDGGADASGPRYATALIYPGEYDDEMARWLLDANYAGGDLVEGGPSHVTNYYEDRPAILERVQLWSHKTSSRSAEEVLATVRQAVQR